MSNFPGMDYLVRVGSLWNNVLLKQSAEMNTFWSSIKDGNYTHPGLFKAWAGAVEDYYSIAVEASKGPGYISRPAWLYFSYSKTTKPVLAYTARLDRSESAATVLDKTDFTSLDSGAKLLAKDVYVDSGCHLNGNELQITLDKDNLALVNEEGQYISFVFGKNRGPEPPLVIVVLRISQ
jgi:hypothetical protein